MPESAFKFICSGAVGFGDLGGHPARSRNRVTPGDVFGVSFVTLHTTTATETPPRR